MILLKIEGNETGQELGTAIENLQITRIGRPDYRDIDMATTILELDRIIRIRGLRRGRQ